MTNNNLTNPVGEMFTKNPQDLQDRLKLSFGHVKPFEVFTTRAKNFQVVWTSVWNGFELSVCMIKKGNDYNRVVTNDFKSFYKF